MKKSFLYLLSFQFVFFYALSQSPAQADWGAVMQHISAKDYAGKNFRFEAAVKVQRIDSIADAEIWFRVDRLNKKTGFFYNMMDKPIRSGEWKVYSISGRIDKDAEYLAYGGLYHRKGVFYYDAFKLFIETTKGQFEEVKLSDGDFEADTVSLKKSWGFLKGRPGITMNVISSDHFSGNQSLQINAASFVREDTYGDNEKTGKYANVNGIKIYYEEYGQGEPLLLLHGNSCSISLFEKQIPELAKRFHVIAVDTRGQGKSGEDGKRYTYDLFADDMNALLDHLKLDSVNILGWSDGGNTGLIMAMKYPSKVKRLVTMGANVFIDKTVVTNSTYKEVKKMKKEFDGDTSSFAKNRLRLIDLLVTEPNHSFEELKTIKCPVFVIAGEKDIIKEGHTKGIAANITNSKLLIAAGETHYFPAENPKVFNAAVIDFLKQ